MTVPVIIDAIVVITLVIFTCLGAKRGLLRTLAGLVIVVVALVGAAMVARTFAGPVSKLTLPLIEKQISAKVDERISSWMQELPEEAELPVEELLALIGMDEKVRESLTQQAQETVRDTGVSIATAVVESLVHSFVYGALFLLSFLALLILLRVLLAAMNLITKLPVVHGLNALGGGALGLIEGALLLFLLVWVARQLGINFDTSEVEQTHILRFFTDNTPLALLSAL